MAFGITGLPLALSAMLVLAASAARGQESVVDVHFISVGQADAALIHCVGNDRFMLVDAADNRYPNSANDFRAYMGRLFAGKQRRIDVVVTSHAHADHVGSMKWVLENFQVGTYVDGGDRAETKTWSELTTLRQKLTKQGKVEYVNGKKAKSFQLEFCPGMGVSLDIFSPWAYSKSLVDPNDRSVIVRMAHSDNSFLFVGDAHDEAEKIMLGLPDDLRKKLDVDVLKVGHHGSHTSSTSEFVMAVSPALALISSGRKGVGTNEKYKHPRYNTIVTYTSWFKTANHKSKYAKVEFPKGKLWAYDSKSDWRQVERPEGMWLTTVDGTVIVRSDGKKLRVLRPGDLAGGGPRI